jgi:hypothetical protein
MEYYTARDGQGVSIGKTSIWFRNGAWQAITLDLDRDLQQFLIEHLMPYAAARIAQLEESLKVIDPPVPVALNREQWSGMNPAMLPVSATRGRLDGNSGVFSAVILAGTTTLEVCFFPDNQELMSEVVGRSELKTIAREMINGVKD